MAPRRRATCAVERRRRARRRRARARSARRRSRWRRPRAARPSATSTVSNTPRAGSASGAGAKSICGCGPGTAANTRAIRARARASDSATCKAACAGAQMTTLLIDNHDSNTFNLFQLLAVVEGREPVVVRNDEADWAALRAERFSRCVISAGPGRPDRPRDFGLSRGALAAGRAAGARRVPRPPGPRARPRRRGRRRAASRCTAAAAASTTTTRSCSGASRRASSRSATTRCRSASRCPPRSR